MWTTVKVFLRDDLETQMPSGRGSTSTALKKGKYYFCASSTCFLDSRVLDRVPTSRHRGEHVHRDQRLRRPYPIRPTWRASLSNRVVCLTAFPKKNSKKLVTGQYFVFLGGTERESHLLTGTPPVVVVVEEKAVAR